MRVLSASVLWLAACWKGPLCATDAVCAPADTGSEHGLPGDTGWPNVDPSDGAQLVDAYIRCGVADKVHGSGASAAGFGGRVTDPQGPTDIGYSGHTVDLVGVDGTHYYDAFNVDADGRFWKQFTYEGELLFDLFCVSEGEGTVSATFHIADQLGDTTSITVDPLPVDFQP